MKAGYISWSGNYAAVNRSMTKQVWCGWIVPFFYLS